jgi:choline dehydrogenase-like flavoprotein
MTIRKLTDTTEPATATAATVCIVGAGVAGLIAAVRLARDPAVRVVVVESGIERNDQCAATLDRIDNPAGNYQGNLRSRGLGGTSSRWDGKLLPISLGDTSNRPWIAQDRWPFDTRELERYSTEIEMLMGVDRASFEEDAAALLDPDRLLPRGDRDFVQRWPKRPKDTDLNIADVLREDIGGHQNIDIWLGATVSGFDFSTGGDRLNAIVAVDRRRHTLTVTADEFLIAAGALESTRLMLVADRQSGGLISRSGDSLGRYFNDHFGIDVATVRPLHPRRTNRAFADRWVMGSNRHLHFELTQAIQRAECIASSYFDFSVELPETSALNHVRLAIDAGQRRSTGDAIKSARAVMADLPNLLRTVLWRFGRKQKFWPVNASIQLKIWIEQLPHRDNRIVLSDTTDELGQPVMHLTFDKTDYEERAFRVTIDRVRAFWSRHMTDVAVLDWIPEADDPTARLVDASVELAHPAGSTRMGTDPSDSVVDPSLRVHSLANVSIASSSVFPSSGSANPTFTIMQLAMRAADAIAARLRLDSGVQSM